MNLISLIIQSNNILDIISKSYMPPDKLINDIFRKNKKYGAKDRKFIAEIIFTVLRNYSLLLHLSNNIFKDFSSVNKNLSIILILIINSFYSKKIFHFDLEKFANQLNFDSNNMLFSLQSFINNEVSNIDIEAINTSINNILDNLINNNNLEYLSTLYSLPLFFFNNLNNSFNQNLFAENSILPAPTFIRVNNPKINFNILKNFFEEQNFQLGTYSPVALRFDRRIKLDDNDFYRSGFYEIQDEGSQLISFALSPTENSYILDACAGAGGKSLHIADLTYDNAKIIATDTEFGRLKEISKRSNRANFKSIFPKLIKTNKISELDKIFEYRKFDFILVDAPCSGSGTIRRDPSRKYKITPKLIEKLANKQLEILELYGKFLKVNGIIVYSTCSVFSQENEDVINKFLRNNSNFVPDSLNKEFAKHNISLPFVHDDEFMLNIAFDKYFGDGFFMARMKRIE